MFENELKESMLNLGANQHMTNSSKKLYDLVKIFELKFTVGHLNGTQALIFRIGNLKIYNNVTLFDVWLFLIIVLVSCL